MTIGIDAFFWTATESIVSVFTEWNCIVQNNLELVAPRSIQHLRHKPDLCFDILSDHKSNGTVHTVTIKERCFSIDENLIVSRNVHRVFNHCGVVDGNIHGEKIPEP